MRTLSLSAGLALALASTAAAQQAEITVQGAQALQKSLTDFLPDSIDKAALVKVRPEGSAYEIQLDLASLLKGVDAKTFTIEGLKPLISLAEPLRDGLWRVTQNQSFSMSGTAKSGEEVSQFTYKAANLNLDGIYDPELFLFKSADTIAKDVNVSIRTDKDDMSVNLAAMSSTLSAVKRDGNKVDIVSKASGLGWEQRGQDASGNRGDVSFGKLDVDVGMDGVAHRSIRDIIAFVLNYKDQQTLGDSAKQELVTLIKSSLPIIDRLSENIAINDIKVQSPIGDFGAAGIQYALDMTGLSRDAGFALGFIVDKPFAPTELVPAAYRDAIPEAAAFKFSVSGINATDGIHYFLDHGGLNGTQTWTPQQFEAMSRIFIPDDTVKVTYDDMSIRSAVYDFSATGSSIINIKNPDRQTMDFTVYARNIDETLAYLQRNTKDVPEFGQASFGLMMAKGFAKQAPDGRQMWHVTMDENKSVTINGQTMDFLK